MNIALFEPEIPPNTGNIIRLCANSGYQLHLIEPLGFSLDDKRLRRAGLDYREFMQLTIHADHQQFLQTVKDSRVFACTTKGTQYYTEVSYTATDTLLFGPETRGLPPEILNNLPPEQQIRIPMLPQSRSLNLANAVAIILYETWRQIGFEGGQ